MIETFGDYKWEIFSLAVLFAGLMLFLRIRRERIYKKEVSALENFDASSMHIALGIFSYFAIDLKRRSIALRGAHKLLRYEANEILEFTPHMNDMKATDKVKEVCFILHIFTRNSEHPEFQYMFVDRKKAVKAIQAISNLIEAETQFVRHQLNSHTGEFRTTVLTELEQSKARYSKAEAQTNKFQFNALDKLENSEVKQEQILNFSKESHQVITKNGKKRRGAFSQGELDEISHKIAAWLKTNAGYTHENDAAATPKAERKDRFVFAYYLILHNFKEYFEDLIPYKNDKTRGVIIKALEEVYVCGTNYHSHKKLIKGCGYAIGSTSVFINKNQGFTDHELTKLYRKFNHRIPPKLQKYKEETVNS